MSVGRRRTPEDLKAYFAAYYQKNRDKALEYARQRREAHRERLRLEAIEYRKRNPDARKRWRLANLERDKARDAAYKRAHVDKIAAYKARPDVQDRMRRYSAEWGLRNRHKRRAYTQNRKARLLAAWVEDVDHIEVWMRGRGLCGICGDAVSLSDFHVDHIVPLVRGGEHSYANVQPAHPTCNLRKGTRAA